jgi:hypothetical protein
MVDNDKPRRTWLEKAATAFKLALTSLEIVEVIIREHLFGGDGPWDLL